MSKTTCFLLHFITCCVFDLLVKRFDLFSLSVHKILMSIVDSYAHKSLNYDCLDLEMAIRSSSIANALK